MTRWSRLLIVALAVGLLVSVCLNLFVAGAWLGGRWADARSGTMVEKAMRPYPPSLRADTRRKLFADRKALRSAVTELRDARQHMFSVMRADPLDRAALDQAMKAVRERSAAVQAVFQTALAESLAEAPVVERRKIGEPRFGFGLFRDRP
jgi:uncharacterized membrane protein